MAKHIEDTHQAALFNWARVRRVKIPDGSTVKLSDVFYAIPNGGKRNAREAARFKAQGVKAGVSDTHLIVPAGGFLGLWIEMKKPIAKGQSKPTVSVSQKNWLAMVERVGHKGIICYGVDEARKAIEEYLGDKLVSRSQ